MQTPFGLLVLIIARQHEQKMTGQKGILILRLPYITARPSGSLIIKCQSQMVRASRYHTLTTSSIETDYRITDPICHPRVYMPPLWQLNSPLDLFVI